MIKSVEEGIYYIFMWTPNDMMGRLPAPFNIENMVFHRFTIRSLLFCVRLCHVLHIHPPGFEQYVTAIPCFPCATSDRQHTGSCRHCRSNRGSATFRAASPDGEELKKA